MNDFLTEMIIFSIHDLPATYQDDVTNKRSSLVIGSIDYIQNESVSRATFNKLDKNFLKSLKFLSSLSHSKLLESNTFFNNMYQFLILTNLTGISNNNIDQIAEKYSFYKIEALNSESSENVFQELNKITLQAYELLLDKIKDMIDFESDENLIDSIPNIDSIVDEINDNYLIPEIQKTLSIEIKINQ